MNPVMALVVAAIPAFVASTVEFVEAFTIVLAVGTTRGWRAPIWGTVAAVATVAVIVLAFGAPPPGQVRSEDLAREGDGGHREEPGADGEAE